MSTGQTSISLYLVSTFILVIGFVYLFRQTILGRLSQEKIDKLYEYFKQFMTLLIVSTIAVIISDMFKEREYTLKDLAHFEKYTDSMMRADIHTRHSLAKYFAIVTPPGEMRKSWQRLSDTLNKELKEIKNIDYDLKKLTASTSNNSIENVEEIKNLVARKGLLVKPPLQTESESLYDVVLSSDKSLQEAEWEQRKVKKYYNNAKIVKRGDYYCTIVPGVKDATTASNLIELMKLTYNYQGFKIASQEN